MGGIACLATLISNYQHGILSATFFIRIGKIKQPGLLAHEYNRLWGVIMIMNTAAQKKHSSSGKEFNAKVQTQKK